MATAKLLAPLVVVFCDERVEKDGRHSEVLGFAESVEDAAEFLLIGAGKQHLVLNTAKERLVSNLLRRQIS